MEQITDLRELLKHELKDLYSAEVQIIDGLPKMIEAARNPQLKKALTEHLKVTREQKKRLEEIEGVLNIQNDKAEENRGFFANLFKSSEGEQHCKAMEGLIKEANSLMKEDMDPDVLDAAIIAAAQKIEHYEIGSYGTARAYAEQMGMTETEKLLRLTLDEEYFADNTLTQIALNRVNITAENAGNEGSGSGSQTSKKQSASSGQSKNSGAAKASSNGQPTSSGKKATTKKAASKKSAPKKATSGGAKKNTSGKAAKKKTASSAKKAPAKKIAVKKAAAKKAAGKKSVTRKSAPKKSAAKKAAPKKGGNNRSGAKKSAGKKSAVKKAAPKKSVNRASAKKSAPKKGSGKKSAAKKGSSKSAAKKGSKKRGGRR